MQPTVAPKPEWFAVMDEMAIVSTEYRSIDFQDKRFHEYFRSAIPELEYGRVNIGSHPTKTKPRGGIETLCAISWIFAWTQTRLHLPIRLGFGAAFKHVMDKRLMNLHMLQQMYSVCAILTSYNWPS